MSRKRGGNTEYLYGYHAVAHAVQTAPEAILTIHHARRKTPNRRLQSLLRRCRDLGIACQATAADKLDAMADGGRHQGIVARRVMAAGRAGARVAAGAGANDVAGGGMRVAASAGESVTASGGGANADIDALPAAPLGGGPLDLSLGDLCRPGFPPTSLLLVLDGVQDPRNLGACLRVANAAGARAVLIPKHRAAPLNATARKAASGAAEHTPVVSVVNLARALRQLKAAGYWILGADAAAADSLFDFVPRQPLALILGAEAAGLRHNTRKQCDYLFHIPMLGEVESLNVSVAAGVCLYQLRSQWSRAPDDSGGKSS